MPRLDLPYSFVAVLALIAIIGLLLPRNIHEPAPVLRPKRVSR